MATAHEGKLALGVDLGGSNLRLGLVGTSGHLTGFHSEPIDPSLDGGALVSMILDAACRLPSFPRAEGIGVGVSASVLKGGGLRPGMTTLPGLGGYPFSKRVASESGRPCVIDNDANLALLGEAHFGAARSMKDVLLLTLGTGVGSGLILGGHLRRGAHSSGCELGLSAILSPHRDEYVPLESLCSPGALMRILGDPRGKLFERAQGGDEEARSLIAQMYEYLGLAIANTHVLLDLELVLLAGGLARSGAVLREGVQAAFERICPRDLQFDLRVELAGLSPDTGGVIGAACLWFEEEGFLQRI